MRDRVAKAREIWALRAICVCICGGVCVGEVWRLRAVGGGRHD
jgi:hypothetical protein